MSLFRSPILVLLVLSLSVTGASIAAPEAPRPMTPEDLWAMERVGAPIPSPDGSQVVFTVSVWDVEENKSNTDLWCVASDGASPPRRLTWHDGPDTQPTWSPDGRSVLFRSKRAEEGPAQFYLLPLADGGEAEPVTDLPVAPTDARWSPDGETIVFLASTWPDLNDDWEKVAERVQEEKDDKVGAKVTETRLVRYWDHYVDLARSWHFFALDLETREVRDLIPGSRQLLPFWGVSGSWDLSPDGKEIAYTANSTEPPYRKLNFDLFTLSLAGGEPRNRTPDNPASDGRPRYSPDGKSLVYQRNLRAEVAPDFTRLARLDRESGRIEPLAEGWDHQPQGWSFSADGTQLLLHATDAGRVHLYRLPLDAERPVKIAGGGRTSAARAAGDQVVFLSENWNRPAELARVDLRGDGSAAPVPLTSFNDERLAVLDLGRLEDLRFRGADGDEVQMFVVLPPGFDAETSWPLLHLVHGGPHGSWTDSFHYRWNMALFAAPGYVVTAVNFHGSTGRGQAFAESILGNHAEKPFLDLMLATDEMLKRKAIDPARMGAAGGSYGGYMVTWILGHSDRFAALIDHAGVYDLMGQFASDWTWGRSNNYGAAPWEDPDRIDRFSPSRFAERFATPTLILHGEKDYRVPYTQALNLHGVLTGKGVPSRLVVYPEENHWILKPQSAFLWWDEVHGWLDRYLGPKE